MNKLLNKITQGNLEVVAANANATLKRSNSKVFVIGNGDGDLPIILSAE